MSRHGKDVVPTQVPTAGQLLLVGILDNTWRLVFACYADLRFAFRISKRDCTWSKRQPCCMPAAFATKAVQTDCALQVLHHGRVKW